MAVVVRSIGGRYIPELEQPGELLTTEELMKMYKVDFYAVEGKHTGRANEAVLLDFCKLAGGFTAYRAAGGWINPETGQLEKDSVLVIAALVDASTIDRAELVELLQRIAAGYKHLTGENSVLFTITDAAGTESFFI